MAAELPPGDAAGRALRGLAKMAGGRLATQAVLLLSAVVIPRVLGAEAFGLYAAVMAVIAILDALATGGLQMVEVRYLAPAWRSGERRRALELGSSIWTARLALSLVAGLAATAWLAGSPTLGLGTRLCLLLGLFAALRYAFEATRHLLLPLGHVGRMALFDLARAVLTLVVVVGVFRGFGLAGVFTALPAMQGLLLGAGLVVLLRAAPLRPGLFRPALLRPLVGFSLLTLVGVIAWVVQAQFAVYAVANWVSLEEAAILGLTVQIYALFQVLLVSARSSLLPILAELESAAERRRLRDWGGRMMRWGAAVGVVALVGWVLVGDLFLELLLPAEFAPAHASAAVILVAVILLACAVSCNGLLYVAGMAGGASANRALFAAVTVAGLLALAATGSAVTAERVAWIYVAAAALFFAVAYGMLAARRRAWLPLRRTLLLILPALAVWPALGWQAAPLAKLGALLLALAVYAGWAVVLGLLPASELRDLVTAVRARPAANGTVAGEAPG